MGEAKKLEQQLKCHSFRMPFLCFIRILSNAAQFERGDYCVISGGVAKSKYSLLSSLKVEITGVISGGVAKKNFQK